MGTANLGKAAQNILDFYQKEAALEGAIQKGRKSLERVDGQILVITKKSFVKGLSNFEKSVNGGKVFSTASDFSKLWNASKVEIRKFLPKIKDVELLTAVKTDIAQLRLGKVRTGKVKVKINFNTDLVEPVGKYSGATGLKKGNRGFNQFLDDYYDKVLKEKDIRQDGVSGLSTKKRERAGGFWDVGHGDFGVSTGAADLIRARQATDVTKLTHDEKLLLDEIIADLESKLEIKVDHDFFCDENGTYKNSYTPLISFQDRTENKKEGQELERAAIAGAKAKLLEIATDPFAAGSPSQIEVYEKALQLYFSNRFKGRKSISLNFKGQRTKLADRGSKKRGTFKLKRRRTIGLASAGIFQKAALEQVVRNRGKKDKNLETKPGLDAARLLGQINKDLGQQVERNMGRPGLRSDSGTFANSARAVTAIPSASLTYIDYTYQKNPYQVFEGGYGYPSAFDPRKVIEKSIRELATRQLETKFVLRRV